MRDGFNREIDYLRISVTDRCNLRCVYCMPAQGIAHKPQSQILSFEEIYQIVKAGVSLGIRKVRITGGEPLVRKDLPLLIEKLKTISALKEIALTTNGIYLSRYALFLKRAGLDRVNISLDSLIPERFEEITRGGALGSALSGIESALAVGFRPVKINVVLLKGFNSDEVLSFAKLSKDRLLEVRFIEVMRTGLNYLSYEDVFFGVDQARAICSGLGKLVPVEEGSTKTAKSFRISGFCGTVGFISPVSQPFCASCNKLRLTSDGRIRNCLHSAKITDLREGAENIKSEEGLISSIKEAITLKPKSHNLANPCFGGGELSGVSFVLEEENFSMCQIGG